jgi:hypothetical protein
VAKTQARIEITAKDRTKSALRSVEANLQAVAKAGAVVTTAAAAAVTALGHMGIAGIKAGDELAKSARKVGTTIEALQGLRLAAAQTANITSQTLTTSLQRLQRRSAEAAAGTGTLLPILKELGIEAQNFNTLSSDEQFRQLGEAMEGVTNQGDRLRISMAAFDTEGAALADVMALGTAGLDDFNTAAEALGLTLNAIDSKAVEDAAAQMGLISKIGEGFKIQLGAEIAPALDNVIGRTVQWAMDNDLVARSAAAAGEVLLTALQAVGQGLAAVGFAFNAVKAAAAAVFNAIFGYLETFYGALARASEFVGLDTIAGGLQSVTEGLQTLQLTTESSLVTSMENMAEFAEFGVEWGKTVREVHRGIGEAVEESAVKQVEALEMVAKKQSKHKGIMGKNEKILTDLVKKNEKAKLGTLEHSVSAAQTLGNALFTDNKLVAAGLIVADTATAIMRALAIYGPTPQGFAAAGAAAATGAVQLAAAQSAAKGGGAVAPVSGGGGGGASAGASSPVLEDTTPAAGPTQSVNISLEGGLYSRDSVRELIRSINDEIGDGAELLVSA